jgi:hypothetical protein
MADLLSYALTTVADVKETLGIDAGNTSKDNLIKRKINQATRMIEAFCGLPEDHHFKQATYTNEEYDGSGSNQLILKMRPVTSITSFQRRNTSQNQSDWDDVESELYFPSDNDAGVVDLLFSEGTRWGSYRVTYVAGYDPIPADLAEACVTLASYLVENGASGTAVKRKQEGAREIEYFAPSANGGGDSLIEQLSLDDMLTRYITYPILADI